MNQSMRPVRLVISENVPQNMKQIPVEIGGLQELIAAAQPPAQGSITTALELTGGANGVIYLDDATIVNDTATIPLSSSTPPIPSGTRVLFCSVYAAITPGVGGNFAVTQTLPGDNPEIYRGAIGANEAGITFGCTLLPYNDEVVLLFSPGGMVVTYASVQVVAYL